MSVDFFKKVGQDLKVRPLHNSQAKHLEMARRDMSSDMRSATLAMSSATPLRFT